MSFSFYCKPATVTVTVESFNPSDFEDVTVESDVETLEIDALLELLHPELFASNS